MIECFMSQFDSKAPRYCVTLCGTATALASKPRLTCVRSIGLLTFEDVMRDDTFLSATQLRPELKNHLRWWPCPIPFFNQQSCASLFQHVGALCTEAADSWQDINAPTTAPTSSNVTWK